jgi:hypothetical protein
VLSRQQPRKKFRAKSPLQKNHSPASLACYANESEVFPSEQICTDKDAGYLRRDVDNPTLGIFRVSACVAALIEATGVTIQRPSQTAM